MTPEEWAQVRAVFDAALQRDPGERNAFLDEACAGNPSLRAEVASLLAAHDRAGSFIEAPAYEAAAHLLVDEPRESLEGRQVGPYLVRQEIGRGGMGVVYLADDVRLSRRVALKALAPGLSRDPGRRERLRQEARAAAALSHPGIATIYALEEIDDALYLACEFVPGPTLRALLQRGPLAPERDRRHRDATRQGAGRRPHARYRAPGSETRERPPHAGRRRQDSRLRHRADRRPPPAPPDPGRRRARHAVVHGSRAGSGPGGRLPDRSVLVRRAGVRDGVRVESFRGRDPRRGDCAGAGVRAGRACPRHRRCKLPALDRIVATCLRKDPSGPLQDDPGTGGGSRAASGGACSPIAKGRRPAGSGTVAAAARRAHGT